MNFGRKMLEFRAKHNLTQTELANIIGVDIITIYRTENEKTKPSKRNAIIYENKMEKWEECQNV